MAYRAEIEIGVKGANKLEQLQATINALANKITKLNDESIFNPVDPRLIQSVQNYSNALDVAAANLRNVALGTKEETQAIQSYVTALGASNQAQTRQNKLIQDEIDLRTEAARVARLQADGIREVTQYAGPIGPGEASPIDAPVREGRRGVEGTVASPIDPSRGVAIQEDQLALEKALLALKERRADVVFEELKTSEALVRSANEAKLIAAEAAGKRLASDISLRSPERAKREERTTRAEQIAQEAIQEAKANQEVFQQRKNYSDQIFSIEQDFNKRIRSQEIDSLLEQFSTQERLETAAFNKALEKDKTRQKAFDIIFKERTGLEISSIKSTENLRLAAVKKENSLRIRLAAKRYRKEQRQIEQQQKRRKEALGSALIGGAFPLLFGQGVGASFGGAVGGFGGGLVGGQFGFGLSLIGTQIGSLFDQLTTEALTLGAALNSLTADTSKVIKSAGAANTEFAKIIQSLNNTKQAGQALDLATQKLAQEIGVQGVQSLENLGTEFSQLQSKLDVLGTKVLAFVSGPLAAFIREVNRGLQSPQAQQIQTLNQARSEFFAGTASPEVTALFEERSSLEGTQAERIKRRLEIDKELVQLINDQNAGLTRQAQIIANNTDLQNLKKTFSEDESVINGLLIDDLEQQFIKLKGNNDILKDSVFEAIKNNIQNEYYRDLIKEQNGELEEGIAKLRRRNSLIELNNKRIKEQNDQTERANREAERAAREAKRVQDEADRAARATRALSIELQLSKDLTGQNVAIAEARRDGNVKLAYTLQIQKELRILAANIAKIKNEDLSTEDELLKISIAREKATDRLNNLEQAELDRKKAIEDAVNKNLRSIQNEIALSRARLNGTEEQIRLEQELQAIKQNIADIEDSDLERIKQMLVLLREQLASEKAIQEVRDIQKRTETAGAGLRAGFIGQAGQAFEQQLQQGSTKERATEIALLTKEMELAELQAQSLQNVVLGIGDAFAAAMTTGVAELVAGTKSAEEVFSDFLKNVGNILLQTAQQMIATYIAIGIARAFAGLAGGGSDLGSAPPDSGGLRLTEISKYTGGLANGGPARAGQPYMVGERGPELFVPSTNGGVMRNEDMRQLMGRSPVGNAPAMNFTFETTNIGGQEFVSREQLEAAMATTRRQAANDGAKRGMNMTLDRMQNSPRTRARVGIA